MVQHLGQLYKPVASSMTFEEADMNELHAWLSQQHHGLRTFKIFQQKLSFSSAPTENKAALKSRAMPETTTKLRAPKAHRLTMSFPYFVSVATVRFAIARANSHSSIFVLTMGRGHTP
jgi:hypothetical protein